MSQLPSLTYENLAASSGRLASLLSTTGSDGSGSNEYYEEVAFRNGVASKGAGGDGQRHNETPEATEAEDDDQVGMADSKDFQTLRNNLSNNFTLSLTPPTALG